MLLACPVDSMKQNITTTTGLSLQKKRDKCIGKRVGMGNRTETWPNQGMIWVCQLPKKPDQNKYLGITSHWYLEYWILPLACTNSTATLITDNTVALNSL